MRLEKTHPVFRYVTSGENSRAGCEQTRRNLERGGDDIFAIAHPDVCHGPPRRETMVLKVRGLSAPKMKLLPASLNKIKLSDFCRRRETPAG